MDRLGMEIVVAHRERATLRAGNTYLKIDSDRSRTVIEVDAMTRAPVPTPQLLWHRPPVLALAALPGQALGRLGAPSAASRAAWTAAGTALRALHDAPLPPRPGRSVAELAAHLDTECRLLLADSVLPADVIAHHRRLAAAALRQWTPVFTHGDLQADHVFVDGDEITGIIDWSEAARGGRPLRSRDPDAAAPGASRRRVHRLRRPRRS